MSTPLWDRLSRDFLNGVEVLKRYEDMYYEMGIFGSLSRLDYTCSSDVDFVIFVGDDINRERVSDLRYELDEVGCDLAVLKLDRLVNPTNLFQKEVVRDYRRVRYGKLRK